MDFRRLAIGNSDGIDKWNLILPKLVTYLSRPYKDDLSKAVAEHLNSTERSQGMI